LLQDKPSPALTRLLIKPITPVKAIRQSTGNRNSSAYQASVLAEYGCSGLYDRRQKKLFERTKDLPSSKNIPTLNSFMVMVMKVCPHMRRLIKY
jgi:hypothetical protein